MATGGKGESLPKLAGSGGRRGASDMLLCAPVPTRSLVNGGSEGEREAKQAASTCIILLARAVLHHAAYNRAGWAGNKRRAVGE